MSTGNTDLVRKPFQALCECANHRSVVVVDAVGNSLSLLILPLCWSFLGEVDGTSSSSLPSGVCASLRSGSDMLVAEPAESNQ